MGGPAYSTQMLRDGAIVEGVSTGGSHDASGEWQTLAGSALRVASGYIDRSEAVIVYDEADKRVMYLLAIVPSLFWQELHERRQLGGDAEAAMWLRDHPCRSSTLRPCRGLWLEPEHPALAAGLPQALRHVLPDARVLQAIPLLPDDLRLTAHPTLFARICPYALCLDGEPSDRHACDLETVITSPSGRCVVVAGSVLDGDLRPIEGVWLVHWQGRWQAIGRRATGGSGKARSGAWIDVIGPAMTVRFAATPMRNTGRSTRSHASPRHTRHSPCLWNGGKPHWPCVSAKDASRCACPARFGGATHPLDEP